MNLTILLPLLEPPPPAHWQEHFASHPPPPLEALLSRILVGAGKVAGSDKKKRTPGQAADAILSSVASHFEKLELRDVMLEYNFFHALFRHSQKENPTFVRATCKSAKFWAANAQVMRRGAAEKSPSGTAMFIGALMTCSTMVHVVQKAEGREMIDSLVFNWLQSGVMDIFEDSIDLIMEASRGASM